MGFAAILDTAETAQLQGVDLYAEQQIRIMTAAEYMAEIQDYYQTHNSHYPLGFCGGYPETDSASTNSFVFELAHNAYTVRKGEAFQWLPIKNVPSKNIDPVWSRIVSYTDKAEDAPRQNIPTSTLMIQWESLTHHKVGK